MEMGGYAGKVLHVDLTKNEIKREPLDPELVKSFIGGFGVNVKFAYDLIKPGIDPLCPENVIIIGVGPLVGTIAPGSSRVYAVAKFPINNTIGWAGGGGMSFGCMLKNAGYDHVIIKGRAAKPVFLKMFDDDVEICDAEGFWGRAIEQTCDELWKKLGRPAGMISIGQAGENLVKFAMAYIDKTSTLGRGGFGAVMGSKNLKAIIARGTKGVRVSDSKKFMRLCEELFERIKKYPRLKEWQELGLLVSLPFLPKELYLEKLKKGRICCTSCPIGDKDVIQIKEGKFKGLTTYTSSVVNMVMPMLWGLPYDKAVKCIALLDDYGMDMFEFFAVLDFVNKLHDDGIVTKEHLESKIEYDVKSLTEWAKKIAYREGFGDVLAEGLRGITEKFGKGSEKFAPPMAKGLNVYVGPKGPLTWERFGTMELDQILSPRGSHVGSGGSPTYFVVRPLEQFITHFDRMGIPEDAVKRILPEPRDWPWGVQTGLVSPEEKMGLNVGRLTRYSEDWFTVLASLGICARAQINRFYYIKLLAELYSAATGIEIDRKELMRRAERVWNWLKAANVREGFSRKDDKLPESWFEKPAFMDYTGKVEITKEIADKFLDYYYDERGWDVEKGVPTREKLLDLGLKNVAEDLERL